MKTLVWSESRKTVIELPALAALSRWDWFRIRLAMVLLGERLWEYAAARLRWGYWQR